MAVKMKNIILIGFMGSGKTSVGIRLSYRLRRTLTDTDKKIKLLLLGVKEGDALSSQELGEMYIKGEEVPKDLKKRKNISGFLQNAAIQNPCIFLA